MCESAAPNTTVFKDGERETAGARERSRRKQEYRDKSAGDHEVEGKRKRTIQSAPVLLPQTQGGRRQRDSAVFIEGKLSGLHPRAGMEE